MNDRKGYQKNMDYLDFSLPFPTCKIWSSYLVLGAVGSYPQVQGTVVRMEEPINDAPKPPLIEDQDPDALGKAATASCSCGSYSTVCLERWTLISSGCAIRVSVKVRSLMLVLPLSRVTIEL